MNDFFDQDEQQDLPKEFQWENMKGSILDKMERIQAEESNSRRFFYFKKRYLALLLFSVSIVAFTGVYYGTDLFRKNDQIQEFNNNLPTESNPEGNSSNHEKSETNRRSNAAEGHTAGSTDESGQENNYSNTEKTGIKDRIEKVNPSQHSAQQQGDKGKAIQPKQDRVQGAEQQPKFADNTEDVAEQFESTDKNTNNTGNEGQDSNTRKAVSNDSTESRSTEQETPVQNNKEDISSADSGQVNDELNDSISVATESPSSMNTKKNKSANLKAQFGLETGIGFWSAGTRQSLPMREQYETHLLSYQTQGYFTWALESDLFFIAGIQYQRLESRLNYNRVIPDYVLTFNDTVIRVYHDVLTGAEEKVYGDVEQTVEAERVVIHYNTTNLFKLSLGGGKSWHRNDLQFDVYGGLSLNMVSQNSGRTFLNNNLIYYEGSSNEIINNRMSVEGFVGARVHYYLDPRMAITGGLQVQQSLTNWSNVENGKMYPISIGLNVGMSYTLQKDN